MNYGYRWVPFLVAKEGRTNYLFRSHPVSSLLNRLVIAQKLKFYRYTVVDSFTGLNKLIQDIPLNDRTLFEVILGEYAQKPHFDIDIDQSKIKDIFEIYKEGKDDGIEFKYEPTENMAELANMAITSLINAIRIVFKEKDIELDLNKNVKLYTSSSKVCMKESYHLIIMGYYHVSNIEAKAFYEECMQHIDPWIRLLIDNKVYSPRQQFRILGNSKYQTKRFKVVVPNYTLLSGEEFTFLPFFDIDIKDLKKNKLYMLLESLVTQTTGCDALPYWYIPKPKYIHEGEELTEEDVKMALKKLRNMNMFFKKREVVDNMVVLDRIAPSMCPICKHIHDHDSPFIIIIDRKIYWNCRRDLEIYGKRENQNLFVGTLDEFKLDSMDPSKYLMGDELEEFLGDKPEDIEEIRRKYGIPTPGDKKKTIEDIKTSDNDEESDKEKRDNKKTKKGKKEDIEEISDRSDSEEEEEIFNVNRRFLDKRSAAINNKKKAKLRSKLYNFNKRHGIKTSK